MSHKLSSLFDDREALARDGEIELTEARSTISDSEWRRREAKGNAELANTDMTPTAICSAPLQVKIL